MRRALFFIAVLLSALLFPWPVTLGLALVGAALFPAYVEGAIVLALVEGASVPDRAGAAWLPLAAAALAAAGVAEIVRPLLARGRSTSV